MALRTLLDDEDRSLILQRLQRVRPDAKPAWGSLDAPRMLCHVEAPQPSPRAVRCVSLFALDRELVAHALMTPVEAQHA